MLYILQTNHLTKTIDHKDLVQNVNLRISRTKWRRENDCDENDYKYLEANRRQD